MWWKPIVIILLLPILVIYILILAICEAIYAWSKGEKNKKKSLPGKGFSGKSIPKDYWWSDSS